MPVEDFVQEFLPPANKPLPTFSEDVLRCVATESHEAKRYDPFIHAIKDWIPDLEAVNTGHRGAGLKPDVCVYDRDEDVPTGANFERLELWIEFNKGSQSVAFHDSGPTDSKESRLAAIEEGAFTPETESAQEIRGQLADYAGTHHAHQFRHFSFSMLITDDHIRFLRWDTAGTVVSSPLQYRDNPGVLVEFLWRFNHLSAEGRGRDPSVYPVVLKPDAAKHIRQKLRIAETEQLFEIHLPGLMGKGHAYGPGPVSQNRSITGRCVRNLPVVWVPGPSKAIWDTGDHTEACAWCGMAGESDVAWRKPVHDEPIQDDWAAVVQTVYMKDTWRFLSSSGSSAATQLMPEHEIYKRLIEKKTPNIPTLVAGGDVKGGLTRTQEFENASWLGVKPKISSFRHYRLVLGVVGHALTTFKCTKELVSVVLDALKAHSHALESAQILHRDISPGNIIRTDNGKGLLIDWELAKDANEVGNRRPDRTGTWPFMSANLLANLGKMHKLTDDLESFLHVLGWMMLSFVPAVEAYTPARRWADLKVFDESWSVDGFDCGGERKTLLFLLGQFPSRYFQPKQSTPLFNLVRSLSAPFKSLYATHPPTNTHEEAFRIYYSDIECLKSSNWFINEIEKTLQDHWPADDEAVILPIHRNPVLETPRQQLIRTGQRVSELEEWETSKSFQSTSAKRSASPTPGPSTKRRRGDD